MGGAKGIAAVAALSHRLWRSPLSRERERDASGGPLFLAVNDKLLNVAGLPKG